MKDNVFDDSQLESFGVLQPLKTASVSAQASVAFVAEAPEPQSFGEFFNNTTGIYRRLGKRLTDILFVLMTLPLTVPAILLSAIVLWIEGGQPFYRQTRLGAGGREFSIIKLRTMHRNADQVLEQILNANPVLRAEWDHTQKLKNDPRITPVGDFLRKTSLDELPQFWNVLTGDMSVVGPRPMMPDQLNYYPDPRAYFALTPGITGQWQVSDRNENGFAHRSTIDARYYSDLSFGLDLRIMLQTVGVVLRRTGY